MLLRCQGSSTTAVLQIQAGAAGRIRPVAVPPVRAGARAAVSARLQQQQIPQPRCGTRSRRRRRRSAEEEGEEESEESEEEEKECEEEESEAGEKVDDGGGTTEEEGVATNSC
jgi:Mg-chelatase subunit ChlI